MVPTMDNQESSSSAPQITPAGAIVAEADIERWATEYADALFRYAMSRVGNREVALELVQETFLAVVKGAEFNGRSSPKTWLIGILRHKIVDHFRRVARSPDSPVADPEAELFAENGQWLAPPGAWPFDPSRALDRKQFRKALQLCLQGLQAKRASIFVLREMEGLSTEELCKEFETTTTNVWVILHRARLALRACLERSGFVHGKELG